MSDWWQADPIAGGPAEGPLSAARTQITVRPQSQFANAIGSVESGGRYDILGPQTRTGDRAYGKYQVMGANVGPWTREVLGQELTPQQFLASPEAQDAVFNAKFGSYAQKYGPEGAARAWFAGEGGMNDPNRRDILGTSVADYAGKFNRAMGFAPERKPEPLPPGAFTPYSPQNAPSQPAQAVAQAADWWQADPIAQPQQAAQQPSQSQAAPAAAPAISQGRAFGEGVRSGATFNFGDELAGASAAGLAGLDLPEEQRISAIARILSVPVGAARLLYENWKGEAGGATTAYEAKRDEIRRAQDAAEKDYPGTYLAGNVTGAVALPIGGVANAATLPARIGRGALTGGVMGGLAGAGAGETTGERVIGAGTGALMGAGAGAALPVGVEGIIRGSRAVAQPIANAARGVRNVDDEAARRVALGLQRDINADPNAVSRMSATEFAQARQAGTPAALMDIGGDTTRAMARSAANTSPEARTALNRTINDRFEGQSGRITGWLNQTFHYPNAHAQQQAIDQVERTVNRAGYGRAMRDSAQRNPAGLWDEGFEQISQAPVVQDAIRKANVTGANAAARQGFTPVGNPFVLDRATGRMTLRVDDQGNMARPTLEFWDAVKKNLDKVGTREARDFARVLRERLDDLVPSYREARAGAAHFFDAENALEAGQNFVRANFQNDQVRQVLSRMTPAERNLFQDGFVSRFVETINATGDRRNVLNQIANSPAAREKLEIALGPQRARELEAMLRVEGIMDLARGAVQGNSTTARQLAELGLAGGAYGIGSGGNFNPMNPDFSALAGAALVYGAARGRNKINENLARRVGEMLASNDPRVLMRGVQIVVRNQQMFNSLRSLDQRLARVGGEQSGGASLVQSVGQGRAEEDQPSVPGRGR